MFFIFRLENLNSLLLFSYLQLLHASLWSLAMQNPILQKSCVDSLFHNSKEMVLLVLQFPSLVLWLCRKFLMSMRSAYFSMHFSKKYSLLCWLSCTCCRHNLFLHSALVLSRKIPRSVRGIKVKLRSLQLATFHIIPCDSKV